MSADQNTTDPAATGTTGDGAPASQTNAEKPTEKLLPQSQVNDLMARTERKYKAELDALRQQSAEASARLAEIEQAKREAEEAKLSATQRQDLERKREREAYEKRVNDLTSLAARERSQRHETRLGYEAARYAGQIATKLFNPTLLPHVEKILAGALVIEDDGQGGERIAIRLGTAVGDTEPLTVETFAKFADANLGGFFGTAGGAGARHGGGAGNGLKSTKDLSASELFELGAQGLKTR